MMERPRGARGALCLTSAQMLWKLPWHPDSIPGAQKCPGAWKHLDFLEDDVLIALSFESDASC